MASCPSYQSTNNAERDRTISGLKRTMERLFCMLHACNFIIFGTVSSKITPMLTGQAKKKVTLALKCIINSYPMTL